MQSLDLTQRSHNGDFHLTDALHIYDDATENWQSKAGSSSNTHKQHKWCHARRHSCLILF